MSLDIMTGKTSVKATLRREMRTRLQEMSPAERVAESQAIRAQLAFPKGAKVAIFAGTEPEPQLLDLILENPHVTWYLPRVIDKQTMEFLPVSNPQNLTKGVLGIREPFEGKPASDLDVIICPGLAFTPDGHRLGQGGGYYDRTLALFPKARTIGVTFSCQLLENLPVEPHDFPMEKIITPKF